MSVYSELMKERLKPEQVYKPPKQTPEQRAENLAAIRKHIADAKAKKAAAAEAKPETDVSHTEYEGPSLREKLEKLREIAPVVAVAARGLAAVASRAVPAVARATTGAATTAGGAATRTAAATPSLASKVHKGVQTGRKVVQGVRLAQDVKQAIDRRRQSKEAEREDRIP